MPKPYPRESSEDVVAVARGRERGVPGDQSAELREARRRTPLVERDRELERIGEFLSSARKGRGGELVVEGPAGIGKTVLLAAGRDVAVAEGFRVLRAR